MSKTQADLAALAYAEVTVSKDAASAADATAIMARIVPLADDLSKRRIITIPDITLVADGVSVHFVKRLVEDIAPMFGRPANDAAIAASEARLREISHLDRTQASAVGLAALERLEALGLSTNTIDPTAAAAAVQGTLDDLKARRIVTLANAAAVTATYLQDVSLIVAARLKPDVPPALVEAAEARLLRQDRLDRTQDDFALSVIELLDAWGQLKPSIDETRITTELPRVLAQLAALDIILISDADSVADEEWPDLVRYVAASLSSPPLFPIMQQAGSSLRQISGPRDSGGVLQADYF